MSKILRILLIVLFAVFIVAATLGGTRIYRTLQGKIGETYAGVSSNIKGAAFLQTPSGKKAVILDEFSFQGNTFDRLDTIDLQTGAFLQRKVLSTPYGWLQSILRYRYVGATDTFLWVQSDKEGIHGRSPNTGEIVIDEAGILAKNPSLSKEFAKRSFLDTLLAKEEKILVDGPSGGLVIRAQDQNTYLVDSKTFLATPNEKITPPKPWATGLSFITLSDGNRFSAPKELINASILVDPRTHKPLETTSPKSVFVLHKTSFSKWLTVSRVTPEGEILWTLDSREFKLVVGKGKIFLHNATLENKNLILVFEAKGITPNEKQTCWIASIRLENGKLNWRVMI